MNTSILKLKKINDIVNNIHVILSDLRNMTDEDAINTLQKIDGFVSAYFSNSDLDDLDLKKVLVEIVDELYIKIMEFEVMDKFTNAYFKTILKNLFRNFAQKEIFAFFVLDNELRDDRFKLAFDLFNETGFAVISPYSFKKLLFSDKHTPLSSITYKKVEQLIDKAKSNKQHIFYVEKDSSVNYLKDILALAEEFQSEYVCIFRNSSIETNKTAKWLMGNFSSLLEE